MDVTTPHPQHQAREIELELPDGVTEEEVEVIGEYCDARGQRDEGMDVVQVKASSKPADPPPKEPVVPENKGPEVVTAAPAAPQVPVAVESAPVVAATAAEQAAVVEAAPEAAVEAAPEAAQAPADAPADAAAPAKSSRKKS